MTAASVFDLHAHVVLEDAFGATGDYGPTHGDDAEGVEYFRIGDSEMKPSIVAVYKGGQT